MRKFRFSWSAGEIWRLREKELGSTKATTAIANQIISVTVAEKKNEDF